MPKKIRELISSLKKAGFYEIAGGKKPSGQTTASRNFAIRKNRTAFVRRLFRRWAIRA